MTFFIFKQTLFYLNTGFRAHTGLIFVTRHLQIFPNKLLPYNQTGQ